MLDLLLKFDYWLFTQINSHFTFTAADSFFVWITDLHKTPTFKALVIPVLLFVFIRKFQRKGISRFIFLVLTLSVSDFTGAKVKDYVERPRPKFNQELQVNLRSDAGSFSFYSNHASNMFATATFASSFFPETRVFLFTVAALVGYSRVYNGVHYPSDVFVGALVGTFFAFLFLKLLASFEKKLEERKKTA